MSTSSELNDTVAWFKAHRHLMATRRPTMARGPTTRPARPRTAVTRLTKRRLAPPCCQPRILGRIPRLTRRRMIPSIRPRTPATRTALNLARLPRPRKSPGTRRSRALLGARNSFRCR